MITKVSLATVGVLSSVGLLAVDDIPGWSDLPALAKVSIIASFVVMVAGVLASLMIMLAKERKDSIAAAEKQRLDFVSEVANSREHQTTTVERICQSFEKSAGIAHADSQAILNKLEQTRDSNERLREHCASVLASGQYKEEREQKHSDMNRQHNDSVTAHEDQVKRRGGG